LAGHTSNERRSRSHSWLKST